MCLVVEKNYELKVATNDIKVYKLFTLNNGELLSPFQGTKYNIGEKFVSNIKKEYKETGYFDTKEANDYGYSYNSEHNFDEHLHINNLTVIQYGIHSIKTLKRAKKSCYDNLIVKCIIPKGSRYIFNKSDLCISDELIPIEIYKPKKK